MDEKIGEIEKAWRDGFGIELNNDDLGKMFLYIKELEEEKKGMVKLSKEDIKKLG